MNWPAIAYRCVAMIVFSLLGVGFLVGALELCCVSVLPVKTSLRVKTSSLWIIAFVVLLASLGVASLFFSMAIYAAETTNPIRLKRIYEETKLFFMSGVFYIILGCFFLFIAFAFLDQTHSAFIFLLAILGIATVLYGTGTQGVGSGNTGTLNVVIAGGAGVLALVFGFGIIQYSDDIQKVFKKTADYGILVLRSDEVSSDYKDYRISAELADGRLLHLWKKDQTVQMIIPIYGSGSKSTVKVYITPPPDVRDIDKSSPTYEIEWQSAKKVHGPSNELFLQKEETLQSRKRDVTITQGDQPMVIEPK